MVDPSYLKLEMKWTLFPFGSKLLFASLRVAGKYIHSVFDCEHLSSRCMVKSNLAKWLFSWAMAFWSSW
jgi:hypothetical protein